MVICDHNQGDEDSTLEKSDEHLMAFLEALKTDSDSTFRSHVGWWWKREYMSELGYFYYLIIFFKKKELGTKKVVHDTYSRHWSSITIERGKYFIPDVPYRDYERSSGFTTIYGQMYMNNDLESFLSSIQRMLMRDIFLRLESHQKFDYCGMGELPKLADYNNITKLI